jgi:hypothetical protein
VLGQSLSRSLLLEVTSLDVHAADIAADRTMHPSTGAGQVFTDCAVPVAAWPGAQPGATTRPTVKRVFGALLIYNNPIRLACTAILIKSLSRDVRVSSLISMPENGLLLGSQ